MEEDVHIKDVLYIKKGSRCMHAVSVRTYHSETLSFSHNPRVKYKHSPVPKYFRPRHSTVP